MYHSITREAYQEAHKQELCLICCIPNLLRAAKAFHSFYMKIRLLHFQLSYIHGSNPSSSMLVHETELSKDSFTSQLAQAATACLQVLSASVMDMLQAGIHKKQEAAVAAPVSSLADKAAVISNEGSNQPSLDSGAAAASSPESTADEAASQSARSCIFEVEVVLTITGTKITPSFSQFLVRLPS